MLSGSSSETSSVLIGIGFCARFTVHRDFFNTYIKFGTRKECDPGPSPGDDDDETFLDGSLASVESPVCRSRIPFYCFGCDLIFRGYFTAGDETMRDGWIMRC